MTKTIWWCEVAGTGTRLHAAYGKVSWENYCAPHIDFRYTSKDPYAAAHSECGLRELAQTQ